MNDAQRKIDRERFEQWARGRALPVRRAKSYAGYASILTEQAWLAWQAALLAQSTPPREPTHAMIDAGMLAHGEVIRPSVVAAVYRAMYDAAPDSATREPEGT
jgi:hypothetical protein